MSPAQLNLSFRLPDTGQHLKCRQVLRYLPEKRLVCLADLVSGNNGEKSVSASVVAKLFFHRRRSRRHWKREFSGLQLLNDNDIQSLKILYKGRVNYETGDASFNEISARRSLYAVLLNLLPEAASLREIWHGREDLRSRVFWLRKALVLLARQHDKGILQEDLHLGNFLISENQLFAIDGDSITALNGPLDMKETWKWVGIFFAQIYPKYDYLLAELLPDYCSARGIICDPASLASVKQFRKVQRKKIRKSHVDKIYRDSGICRTSRGLFHLICCIKDYSSTPVWSFIHQLKQVMKKKGRQKATWEATLEGSRYQIQYFPSSAFSDGTWLPENEASVRWREANIRKVFGEETEIPVALYVRKIGPLHFGGCYISMDS